MKPSHDMETLAALVRELEDQLSACTRCGTCQAVCPLFRETGREAQVARGKLALLKGLMEEAFQEPHRSLDLLSCCLLCGACEVNCPSGVRVLEVFLKARAVLTGYLGMPPPKRAVFRGLLARPERFNRLLSWGARVQKLFLKPADELLGTSCARFSSPLSDRHVRALAPVPFHRQIRSGTLRPPRSGIRAAFFYGCLIDKIYPEIGQAVIKNLDRFRVEVSVPEQGCCGLPALSAGDLPAFRDLVTYHLDKLAPDTFDVLITACPTCAAAIKRIWPVMSRDRDAGPRTQIADLAQKTVDITDFLVNRIGILPLEAPSASGSEPVLTYHDPCHLRKSLGVSTPPRTLLKSVPGYRFREMAEAEACCGCGGSFTLEHYELSKAVGERKRSNILKSGAALVATACPACMLQLSDLLSRGGDKIRVRHVIELFAELGLPGDPDRD